MGSRGKPVNAKSAYNYFTSLMHEEFKAVYPGKAVDFIDFQRKCAAKWKSLTGEEKGPFEKMAALDKRRFQEEVKIFPPSQVGAKEEKKRKKAAKDPNEPKRPLSAFFLFSNDKRAEVKAANPESSIGEVGKKLGELWRDLGDDRKRVFEDAAKREKDRYARAMEAFKEGRLFEDDAPLPPPPKSAEEPDELSNENTVGKEEAEEEEEKVVEEADNEAFEEKEDIQKEDVLEASIDDFDKLDDLLKVDNGSCEPAAVRKEANEQKASETSAKPVGDFDKLDELLDAALATTEEEAANEDGEDDKVDYFEKLNELLDVPCSQVAMEQNDEREKEEEQEQEQQQQQQQVLEEVLNKEDVHSGGVDLPAQTEGFHSTTEEASDDRDVATTLIKPVSEKAVSDVDKSEDLGRVIDGSAETLVKMNDASDKLDESRQDDSDFDGYDQLESLF